MKIPTLIFILTLLYSGVSGQWQQTSGPAGGHTSHLIQIADRLFVNGQSGGIFTSVDRGVTWTAVNNGLPSYPHCLHLTHYGNNLYASISSKGIYFSADFGENWQSIGLSTGNITSYALAVYGQQIYAGNSEGGFYSSADHGQNWSLHQGSLRAHSVRDFVVSGNTIFAAVNGGTGSTGIYKSEDKGSTWTKLNLAVLNITAMSGYDNALYVSDGSLKVSRDYGATWSSVALGTGVYVMSAMHAIGDDIYVGASGKAIFYSQDEGQTWTSKLNTSPDNNHYSILADGNDIWLATTNGVFYSSNGGNTFVPANNGLRNEVIKDLTVDADTVMAVTVSTGLFNSWDNGNSWSAITIGSRDWGSNVVTGIHVGDGYKLAGTFQGIFKTNSVRDGWTRLTPAGGNKPVSTLAGDNNKAVAAVYNQGVYTSLNGGEDWVFKPVPAFGDRGINLSALKGDTIIVASPEVLFISKDFGTTWQTSSLQPTYFVPNAISFAGSSWIVVAYQGIFKSLDHGASWKRIDDLPSHLPPQGIVISEEGNYYVGTPEGVYISYNRGVHWYPLNTGLRRDVTSLAIQNELLLCGTFGMGVWVAPINLLNVRPQIVLQKTEFTITNEENVELALEDFQVTDPDNESLTLIIGAGSNYTVVGNVITPAAGFVGDLSVRVQAGDGMQVSDVFNATVRVSAIVGTTEFIQNLKIYPNPTFDKIYVDYPTRDWLQVLLFDQFGKLIKHSRTWGTHQLSLDLSGVAAGLYVLNVQSGGKTKIVRISKR